MINTIVQIHAMLVHILSHVLMDQVYMNLMYNCLFLFLNQNYLFEWLATESPKHSNAKSNSIESNRHVMRKIFQTVYMYCSYKNNGN